MTESQLQVIEFNGVARSGKGIMVAHLCETFPEIVTAEETGVDYRIMTASLLLNRTISESMTPDEVTSIVVGLTDDQLAKTLADRENFLKQKGELYTDIINGLVASVGRSENARHLVKDGFKKRVENIRDSGDYRAVLLDGRNLAPVVQGINGVTLALRVFVDCSVEEAARREALRAGVEPASPAGQDILRNLEQRGRQDRERDIDPVRPDENAVDYWKELENGNQPVSMAQASKRQLLFETTHVSKDRMLKAAEDILKVCLKLT